MTAVQEKKQYTVSQLFKNLLTATGVVAY